MEHPNPEIVAGMRKGQAWLGQRGTCIVALLCCQHVICAPEAFLLRRGFGDWEGAVRGGVWAEEGGVRGDGATKGGDRALHPGGV